MKSRKLRIIESEAKLREEMPGLPLSVKVESTKITRKGRSAIFEVGVIVSDFEPVSFGEISSYGTKFKLFLVGQKSGRTLATDEWYIGGKEKVIEALKVLKTNMKVAIYGYRLSKYDKDDNGDLVEDHINVVDRIDVLGMCETKIDKIKEGIRQYDRSLY